MRTADITPRMRETIRLIFESGMTVQNAAKLTGVERSSVYRSKLYLSKKQEKNHANNAK